VFSRLVWRSHRCYFRSAAGEIRLLEQPLTAPSDVATALPVVPLGPASKRLVLQTESVEFGRSGAKYTLVVVGQRRPHGRQQPERVRLEFAALPRNH
jgi:hypothetical protein